MTESIWQSLIESKWSGGVSEAGLGVPIQSKILEIPGASGVLKIGLCPYSKDFQGDLIKSGSIRSVSMEGVRYRAEELMKQLKPSAVGPPLFAIATSVVYTGPDVEIGESHGWVYLIKNSNGGSSHFSMHFWMHKSGLRIADRKGAIEAYTEAVEWFLNSALMGRPWSSPNYPLQGPVYVDVVNGPGVDFNIQMGLLTEVNPICFDSNGQMVRPADLIRKYGRIYRGSFNPPTKAHEKVGRGSIYEICGKNVWGKSASDQDIKHRIEMLRLIGANVMISAEPFFADLNSSLHMRGISKDPITYIVGSDVMNAIVDPKNIRWDGFLDPLLHPNAKFEVHLRSGMDLVFDKTKAPITEKMDIRIVKDIGVSSIASTQARNGDMSALSKPVADYIKKHKLYKVKKSK